MNIEFISYEDAKRMLPDNLLPGYAFAKKVVAVVGNNHDWTAYEGPTDWDDIDVATKGNKISWRAADELFYVPSAAGLDYRE